MTTDITELALIKGQKVEAPYYLAECTECGKMYSSSKLIVSRNYFDGDADCYCPHCNADDADIADLGSGEQPAVMAWNYQQARIDVLVEALVEAHQQIGELEQKHCGGALMEREIEHSEVTGKLISEIDIRDKRIAELESSGIAPGILRCTECSFVLTKNTISVSADTITTVESEPEPCPNGCGPLQPATWKALAIQLMFSTKQGVTDLLEAKKHIAELEPINAAAEKLVRCKGRYHSEQNYRALAALFGVNTPDLPPLDGESRTVTVKLPEVRITVAEALRRKMTYRELDAYNAGALASVEKIQAGQTDAGIKWEAE